MELITKRRKYKRDSCEYKETDKKVRMKCKEAKEKYMNDQFEELENLQKKGHFPNVQQAEDNVEKED